MKHVYWYYSSIDIIIGHNIVYTACSNDVFRGYKSTYEDTARDKNI